MHETTDLGVEKFTVNDKQRGNLITWYKIRVSRVT